MRIALFAAFAMLAVSAGPAAAGGPQASGLWLTEAVAREAAATVTVRHRNAACLDAAAQQLSAQPGVRKVAVGRAALRVTYPTPALAAEAAAQVRSAVDAACGAATVAGADPAVPDAANPSVANPSVAGS
ncbi:hypothetical protein LJR219_000859 [Phenylobacterium sp. LjRoot219]|uniref:hypothetical protein n=1 Tax=Phenylobacterium sp. LjRoot219 TaxID=3342283 RepID=UPI003ECF95E2